MEKNSSCFSSNVQRGILGFSIVSSLPCAFSFQICPIDSLRFNSIDRIICTVAREICPTRIVQFALVRNVISLKESVTATRLARQTVNLSPSTAREPFLRH